MRLRSSKTLVFLLGTTPLSNAIGNLRNPTKHVNHRNLGKTKSNECTIVAVTLVAIDPGTIEDTTFECEMDASDTNGIPGLSRKINGSPAQMASLNAKFNSGDIVSGETMLVHGPGTSFNDEEIYLSPDLDIKDNTRHGKSRRRLAVVTGPKPVLAVRVTDSAGWVHPHDAATMSDNIFGTYGDPVNLKTQLTACSFGQLEIQSAGPGGVMEVAPGMIELTIDVPLQGTDRVTVRNALVTAAQNKLGHSLPGPYHHVMFSLQGCYTECGWAAYALVNGWYSVYQSDYYSMTGVQLHELGHNFNLAHSGGLDGATYTDHTGMMGNPLYSDDVGKMCYNPAKNWQLGWYDLYGGKMLLPTNEPSFSYQQVTLVGMAEYDKRTNNATQPITVKLETGLGNDFFIGFNRATGANSQNDEADNLVTVVQVDANDGEWYSQSYLRATLPNGQSHVIVNFGGLGRTLTITATDIDITTTPGVATVCISFHGSCGTAAPTTTPPTTPPTAPPPTAAPTLPQPTKSPTPSPTDSPTRRPTPNPTKQPTPVQCDTIADRGSCDAEPKCSWIKQGKNVCVEIGSCTASGRLCDGNCCNGCQNGGRNSGYCK